MEDSILPSLPKQLTMERSFAGRNSPEDFILPAHANRFSSEGFHSRNNQRSYHHSDSLDYEPTIILANGLSFTQRLNKTNSLNYEDSDIFEPKMAQSLILSQKINFDKYKSQNVKDNQEIAHVSLPGNLNLKSRDFNKISKLDNLDQLPTPVITSDSKFKKIKNFNPNEDTTNHEESLSPVLPNNSEFSRNSKIKIENSAIDEKINPVTANNVQFDPKSNHKIDTNDLENDFNPSVPENLNFKSRDRGKYSDSNDLDEMPNPVITSNNAFTRSGNKDSSKHPLSEESLKPVLPSNTDLSKKKLLNSHNNSISNDQIDTVIAADGLKFNIKLNADNPVEENDLNPSIAENLKFKSSDLNNKKSDSVNLDDLSNPVMASTKIFTKNANYKPSDDEETLNPVLPNNSEFSRDISIKNGNSINDEQLYPVTANNLQFDPKLNQKLDKNIENDFNPTTPGHTNLKSLARDIDSDELPDPVVASGNKFHKTINLNVNKSSLDDESFNPALPGSSDYSKRNLINSKSSSIDPRIDPVQVKNFKFDPKFNKKTIDVYSESQMKPSLPDPKKFTNKYKKNNNAPVNKDDSNQPAQHASLRFFDNKVGPVFDKISPVLPNSSGYERNFTEVKSHSVIGDPQVLPQLPEDLKFKILDNKFNQNRLNDDPSLVDPAQANGFHFEKKAFDTNVSGNDSVLPILPNNLQLKSNKKRFNNLKCFNKHRIDDGDNSKRRCCNKVLIFFVLLAFLVLILVSIILILVLNPSKSSSISKFLF